MRVTFSRYKKALTILIFLTLLSFNTAVFAYGFDDCKSIDEIDSIRAELFYTYDKTSPAYLKVKQKLDKLILKEKLDYSFENRFRDAIRLINNQNYGAASYEVTNLIENEYNISKCYEMLADICRLSGKYPYKAENYYILSLKADNKNLSAQYKLIKLYFSNNKNTLALEYLRDMVDSGVNDNMLSDIRNLILNQVIPQDKYEANNLYEILGNVYIKLNLPYEAYNAYEKAIQANEEDIYLKYYLADLYYAKNMLDEALLLYQKIIAQQPSDTQIRLSSAKILEQKGELLSAYKQYLQILAYDNDNSNIKYRIYRLHRGYDPETILKRVYLNRRGFVVTSEEFLDFAKILKEHGEPKMADKFIACAKEFEADSKSSIAQLDSNAKQNLNTQNNQKATMKTYIQKEEPTRIQPKKQPNLKPEIQSKIAESAITTGVVAQNALNSSTSSANAKPKLKPEIKQEQQPKTQIQQHTQNQPQQKQPVLKPSIAEDKSKSSNGNNTGNNTTNNAGNTANNRANSTANGKNVKLKPEIKQEKPIQQPQRQTQAQQPQQQSQQSRPQSTSQQTNKTQQTQNTKQSQPKLKPQIQSEPQTNSQSQAQFQLPNQYQQTPQEQTRPIQSAKSAQAKRNQEQSKQPKLQPKLDNSIEPQEQKPSTTQKQPSTQTKPQTKPQQTAKQLQKSNEIMGALTPEQEKKILEEISKPLKVDKTSKKYLEFKKVIDKYQAIEPKDKLTYIAIANTYKLMGELYLAIDNYNKALKLEPTDSDIQYNLGLTNMELDKFETAKIHLEKAISLDKDNQKAITLLSFVNQKIITNIINIAYGKFEKEQYVPAFQILDTAIKKYPKNAQLYYYRALVFDKMNRNAAQIIDLQKAIELDPAYYMSYYQLGLAYEKIRNERSALVAYERFLSTEPDEKELVDEVVKKVTQLSKKYY